MIGMSLPQRDIYLPELATVIKTEPMTAMERFLEVRLDSGRELGHMPGQFVEISVFGIGEAPISVSSSPTKTGSFEIIVRNAGNVTNGIHALKAGDRVGIRGPFGTHFPVESELKGKDIIFVCGGLGLVPVRSAINYALDHRQDYGKLSIYFGTKTPADRLCCDEVKDWTCHENICYLETVDRGDEKWNGKVGVITTLMTDLKLDPERTAAIVVGPPVMYKFAVAALRKAGMLDEHIWVSLERHMKCGVGKCGHCQIDGLYVCQEGPVFRFSEVRDVPEAIR